MYRRPMYRRFKALSVAACALAGVTVSLYLAAQPPRGFGFNARMDEALAETFVGVTADGTPQSGLFEIEATGVSTAPVREAAQSFLDTLTEEQRARAGFDIDDSEWRNWANVHLFERQGIGFDEMTEAQREAAFDLLRAGLSERGFETSRDIMRLNHHLAELVSNFDEYGEYLYWLSFMGTPSANEPWGWQLDGHHLVINYFVLGDQVVMTPTFMGSEPLVAQSGQYEGTRILDAEQTVALQFMQSLSAGQQAEALVSASKNRGENRAEMMRDNAVLPVEGLQASRLDAAQKDRLLELVGLYVGQMAPGHAAVRMAEIEAHIDETFFAWKGATGPDAVFYYRVQSPVIYIEFDHQGPTALEGPRNEATRNHAHSVVRTPNGNDYGKDLLRQHYERYANDPAHGHIRAAL